MGEVVLAAKITHVPTMLLLQQLGKTFGCIQHAIDEHKEIVNRAIKAGADTIVI